MTILYHWTERRIVLPTADSTISVSFVIDSNNQDLDKDLYNPLLAPILAENTPKGTPHSHWVVTPIYGMGCAYNPSTEQWERLIGKNLWLVECRLIPDNIR